MDGKLTSKDHEELDEFLKAVFEDVKSGKIDERSFVGGMAHVLAALDKGNVGEALSWFKNRSEFFKLDNSKLSGGAKLG